MTEQLTRETELMQRIARRDAAALRALYDQYGRISFGLAYRVIGDATAAEEVVQDAFVTIWNKAASFDEGKSSNVRGWLLSIVHNRSIDYRRRELDRGPDRAPMESAELELSTPDVWNEVGALLDAEEVRAAMSDLPDEQRRLIEMSFFHGLTHAEIASKEDASLGTVKSRIRLGLKKLSTALRPGMESAGTAP